MTAKTSLKKWIRVFSIFIAVFPTHLLCQMSANFPGVGFLRTTSKFEQKGNFVVVCTCLPSSTKHEIRHFHVEFEQWRQRNIKSVLHVQSCWVCLKGPIKKIFSSPPASFLGAASLFFIFWLLEKLEQTETNRGYFQHQLFYSPS